jgi:hypothetical protein
MTSDSIKRPRRIIGLTPPTPDMVQLMTQRGTVVSTIRRIARFQHVLAPSLLTTSVLTTRNPENKIPELLKPAANSCEYELKPDLPKAIHDINIGLGIAAHCNEVAVRAEIPCVSTKTDTNDLPLAEIPAWINALADLIAETCNGTDEAFSHWSVVVPLDPELLPETTLRIDFSPHRLLLRFCTQSSQSLDLLSFYCGELILLLTKCLPDSRNIEVDIT